MALDYELGCRTHVLGSLLEFPIETSFFELFVGL